MKQVKDGYCFTMVSPVHVMGVYSIGAAILDIENPFIVRYRCGSSYLHRKRTMRREGLCQMYVSLVRLCAMVKPDE